MPVPNASQEVHSVPSMALPSACHRRKAAVRDAVSQGALVALPHCPRPHEGRRWGREGAPAGLQSCWRDAQRRIQPKEASSCRRSAPSLLRRYLFIGAAHGLLGGCLLFSCLFFEICSAQQTTRSFTLSTVSALTLLPSTDSHFQMFVPVIILNAFF